MDVSPSRFNFLGLLNQLGQFVAGFVIMIGVGIILPFRIVRTVSSNLFRQSHHQLTFSFAEKADFILRHASNFALFVISYEIVTALSNMQTASAAATPAPTYPPMAVYNNTDAKIGVSNNQIDIISTLSNISFGVQALIYTIPIQWVGSFVDNSISLDTVIALFRPKNAVVRLTGTPGNVSFALKTLRFSLFDNITQHNLSQITVYLFAQIAGNVTVQGTLARATVDLTYFGTNAAPVPSNASYINETVNLDTQFSIDLAQPPRFIDPDGDPVSYLVTLADGSPLPPSVQVNNNVLVGSFNKAAILNFLVSGTDGYKISPSKLAFTVACLYMPPFVANVIPARLFPVGQGFTLSIPLSTFTGINLIYKALANGFPLPKGLDFNADLKLLTGFMSSDWSGNITIIATDPYRASANTTFELSVFDAPPELATPIATQTVRAKKTIVVSIPPLTFIDPDNLPSPLVYMIDSLADGTPLPSWIVYNANTKQITAIPPVEALGQDFQIVMTASDGYKSTDANITLRVLPNQPPVIGQALSDATAIANQDLNYLIPPNSFTSPVGNPLTLTVQMPGDATQQLPGWVNFNNVVNVLYGRPADTDVGIVPMVVIADDGLGGIARQTINITVQQSALALFLYWLGLTAQAGSGVLFAWSAYVARNQVLNHFRAKKVICEHPFDENLQHKIDYPYAAYVLAERIPHPHEVGKLSQWIAGAVSLMSSYFHHQFALAPLPHGSLPYWLNYHATRKIITLKPELINEGDESVIVTVRTLEGEVLVKFTVNPFDYQSIKLLILPQQEQLVVVPAVLLEKEIDSLNTSPDAPSVGPTSSTDSTPEESMIQLALNTSELIAQEKKPSLFLEEDSSEPSNQLNYNFFAQTWRESQKHHDVNEPQSYVNIGL